MIMTDIKKTIDKKILPIQLICFSGADAKSFLHGQLSQSIVDLNTDHARLFTYCNNKGRVIANGIVYIDKENDDNNHNVYTIVDKTIAITFIKKISMFILRAKVSVNLIEANLFYTLDKKINYAINDKNLSINLTSSNLNIDFTLNNNITNIASIETFKYDTFKQGLCFINQHTTELYVPQMLCLDKNNSINFKKGCYPGQEIVARSQYLGKIKKTLILANCNANGITIDTKENLNNLFTITNTNYKLSIEENNQQNEEIASIVDATVHENKIYLLLCLKSQILENNNNLIIIPKHINSENLKIPLTINTINYEQ